MANFTMTGLDEMLADMTRKGQRSGQIAIAMCNIGAGIIKDEWVQVATEHDFIDTGEMIASIGFPAPVTNMGSFLYRDIYPQGKDSKGVRNAEKAFILHYGSSKLSASYWVDEADNKAVPKVESALQEAWYKFCEDGTIPTTV